MGIPIEIEQEVHPVTKYTMHAMRQFQLGIGLFFTTGTKKAAIAIVVPEIEFLYLYKLLYEIVL